jgi:uncharacterized protein YijF (DUF1287 family)
MKLPKCSSDSASGIATHDQRAHSRRVTAIESVLNQTKKERSLPHEDTEREVGKVLVWMIEKMFLVDARYE